ncbi:MAG: tetratricopeptide repeat protein, partial [Pseudomonadota bacterium]
LSQLYEDRGEHDQHAELLAARLHATVNPFEITALHLARAELFAGPLGARASAKEELQAILQKEPHHAHALARLADLELADDNPTAAAELEIRRASIERAPERLREIFLRLGRIHTGVLPDTKRAVGAYSRVLQLDPDNREALDALSLLYVRLGETKNALAITDRLAKVEPDKSRRAEYHVRLGQLFERAGDPRAAAQNLRLAVDESPRNLAGVGELARFLERTRDVAGRRILLDRVATELRLSVHEHPRDPGAWADLATVLTWRGRTVAARAATELGQILAGGAAPDDATLALDAGDRGGRRLVALSDPAVDERTFPASVSSPLRQLFRLLGPMLADGLKIEFARPGLDRQDRVTGDRPPRDVLAPIAIELGLPAFDLYVPAAPASGGALWESVPGKPPIIVMSADVIALGVAAVRFAGAAALRLAATHLNMAMAGPEADFGALLAGIVRQFVPEYTVPNILEEAMVARSTRVARLLPRRMRQDLMPFAMECSGPIDLGVVRTGLREAANRVGLLSAGSITPALAVLAARRGEPVGADLLGDDDARALIDFSLSDEYDDLVRLMA